MSMTKFGRQPERFILAGRPKCRYANYTRLSARSGTDGNDLVGQV
ncbi:hypothetical protein [Arenibacter sp. P308M17]|nr:hypothetical protein [Arenibacter sp. P308M17]